MTGQPGDQNRPRLRTLKKITFSDTSMADYGWPAPFPPDQVALMKSQIFFFGTFRVISRFV